MSAKWRRGWSLLLTLALLLGMMPVMRPTAMAAEDPYGVSSASKWGTGGNIYFTVDDGVLTWDDVPGATSYDLNIYMTGGLVKSETGLTSPYYELEEMLDDYKKDSGTVEVHVNVWGGSVRGDTANFLYSSPYPKLEAPTTLYWGGNDTIADWDDVPHADGYTIYLYQSSGSGYNHWTTEESRFDFAAKDVTPGDGWYFKVMATSEGNYRNSEYNESRRVGNVSGDGVRAESKPGDNEMLTFTVNDAGVLSWTAAPEATCYDLIVRLNGSLFQSETVYSCNYDLQDKLNTYNADTGLVEIVVDPIGDVEYRDGALFLYSSPYVKLEAPVNLAWNGATATWDDVLHADGYTVYLYQSSGSGYNHWTTTNTSIDFSDEGVNPGDGWYFKVMATSDGDFRNSVYNESPRKSVYGGSQTFNIGAYAHDMTLGEEGGGEVYLDTSNEYFDWSSEGYTKDVQAGAYVTIKAKPDDGYEFVEWRQGTGGDTISTNANYSFYCTGNQYLYAIFRRIGTIFPEGAGETEGNPAMCYSYEEFKYAMESNDIRYVALANVNDTLPLVSMEDASPYGDNRCPGIWVNSNKDLILSGNAQFTAPNATENEHRVYDHLIQVRQGGRLTISGTGSLTFHGNALGWVTSAVEVVDSSALTINSGTVKGDTGNRTAFCYGVNVNGGTLYVNDGTVIGTNRYNDAPISAVNLYDGVAYIHGGTFYSVVSDGAEGSDHYGLSISEYGTGYLSGGAFEGVSLPNGSYMNDYVKAGYTMTANGVEIAPANCGTTDAYVEVFKAISNVDIHVNSPVAGESPAMYPEDVYMVPEGVTVKDPVWYENGQPWNISNGSERFEAGSTYQVELTLVADAGVKFINPLTSATINYQNAQVSAFAGNAEKGITLTVYLGECPNTVSKVAVEIDAPRKNATPDRFVTIMDGACQQSVGYGIRWQKSINGSDWTDMEETETFEIGNHHRVFINLAVADGYEFALDAQLDPDVSATVNGNYAEVFRYPEENPDELIFLRYDFGALDVIYIDQIRIEDVVAPVAGEAPSYTCTMGGEGYTINTAYSGGATINGIFWYDLTDDVEMKGNRTFTLGNQYKVVIDVKTEDGYEFATTKLGNSYEPAGSAYVNGEEADFGISLGEWIYEEQNVQYIFTCGNQEISTVMLYNLEEPVGGNVPDTNVTPAYPEHYTVQSVTWTDIEGGAVGATFETGVPYRVTIEVKASAQAYFTADPTVYIDETQVSWRNVTVEGDTVTIVYTFSQGASAPEIAPPEIPSYEITEIKSVISAEHVPKAGMEVSRFMPGIPDGEPYGRYWNGSEWRDENGVLISANIGHHYDLGYEFEAGRTYTTDGFYFEANSGYTFAEDATVHLTGPERSMWDYEVTGFNDDHTVMFVRFTFRIPGDRNYPDINKVSMVYYGTHAAGGEMPDPARLIYNNCAITREEWNTGSWDSDCTWDTSTGENRFEAGNTYVHMIELTALPGYKFSENLLAQKGMQGEEEYGDVSLSDDRTVATVTYTYHITEIQYLNTVTLEAKAGDEDFYLIRQGDNNAGGLPFTTTYTLNDQVYEIRFENYFKWYDVETGKEILSITNTDLEVGKKYRLEFLVDIKDDYDEDYRFGENPTLVLKGYQHANANFVQIENDCDAGATQMNVAITYTAQPKPGEGSGSYYPMVCYSYEEFKYAMENEDIRYVALSNVDETIPAGDEGLVTAIHVNGIKNLNLLGNATFTAPANVATTYAALLHTTQNTTLNISGAGSLTFKAVANNSFNAVIYNQGGSVNIYEGTLIGSYNTAVYGKAIWQEYGELRISGGQLFAENALAPGSLPSEHTAVYIKGGQAWIEGGTFKTENAIDTIDLPYGLDIGQYATVDLSGGTFYGILLPTSSTPLANYMDEDIYTPLTNESKFNPASEYSQEYTASGKIVRIAWLIDHVDVHINAPIAGVDITENYFNIPTSGCQAAMYYPMWYKNGEPVTYGTFEAGASYKVVVRVEPKPSYGIEFTSDITAALNIQNVALKSHGQHFVEFEYDFGVCPNVVPKVDLTVTAPKEGATPIGAMGGATGATVWDTEWLVSDTGMGAYQFMQQGDTFAAGKYYKVRVQMKATSGYEFPTYDDGVSIMPATSATVNGYYADVKKTYGQSPSEYFDVEYDFGICNDSIIEQIVIENIVAPVAGDCPSYSLSIAGSAYASEGDYGFQQKNGMMWADVTNGGGILYDDTKFIAGHTYQVTISLHADEGYEFKTTGGDNIAATTATVNGYPATVKQATNASKWQTVTYQFTCQKKEISTIMILLDAPQAGKTPADYIGTTAYPELYQISEYKGVQYLYWYDLEGNPLESDQEFVQGERYKVEIKVIPTEMSYFSNVTAYINGQKVEARVGALNDGVTDSSSTVAYITYTFIDGGGASAPEVENDPIFQWNGDACTVYSNGSGATMAASYTGGKLTEVAFFENNVSVTLTGDTVRVFFLHGNSFAPLRPVKPSTKP